MTGKRRLCLAWIGALAASALFIGWTSVLRIHHLTEIARAGGGLPAIDVSSPTGYAGDARAIIVPAHSRESYDWIEQTQDMLHRGAIRIRNVADENVPFGREVRAASPYRWWLAATAALVHLVSGEPWGICVERAALYADPLAYLLLLAGVTGFAAWRFGSITATVAAIATAAVFPLGASFLPGAPDDQSLAIIAALGSVLLLLPAIEAVYSNSAVDDVRSDAAAPPSSLRRWAAAAGIAGGLGVWNDPAAEIPVLAGIAAAGILLAWWRRRETPSAIAAWVALWQTWAASGATVIFAGFLIEYFPSGMHRWDLDRVHPLFGLAWLGAAGLIVPSGTRGRRGSARQTWGRTAGVAIALIMLAAPMLAHWLLDANGFLRAAGSPVLLTKLPDGLAGSVMAVLIARGAIDAQLLAAVAPALLLLPILWIALRPSWATADRAAAVVVLVPGTVVLGFSLARLGWWPMADGVLIVATIVATHALWRHGGLFARALWAALAVLVLMPGLVRLWPAATARTRHAAPVLEIEETIERDLARWLARRGGGGRQVVVWAPPELTRSLNFYGSLRGLGTHAPENRAGLSASQQIAESTSHEEALARLRHRGVTHLVLPSWEGFFGPDPATSDARPGTFIGHLRAGALPPWLHPVSYPIPPIEGLDEHSVTILDVIDEQDEPLALSRFAEFFVEAGELDRAGRVAESLERFPSDLAALVARIEVARARGDPAAQDRASRVLRDRLGHGADRFLPWDRRVSLTVELAHEKDLEDTVAQMKRCLADAADARLRFLSPKMLFDFQRLAALLDLRMADPGLQARASELLPVDLRRQLGHP